MTIKDHKSLQGSKILLVEDDKSIRLTVSESLKGEGFQVLTFKETNLLNLIIDIKTNIPSKRNNNRHLHLYLSPPILAESHQFLHIDKAYQHLDRNKCH